MKKIRWILLLLLIVFVGDRLAGLVLKQLTSKSQFRYSRLYTGKAASDILLVGNSRGLLFYQPYIEEKTGKETMNLSYNGIPSDLMNTLVQDYFERYPAPQQMIVDITLCDRLNPQLIAGFNPYTPYSDRLGAFIINTSATMGNAAKVSHLFRYNSEIFQRALLYVAKGTDEDWLNDRVMNQNLVEGAQSLEPFDFTFEPDTTDRDYLLRHLNEFVQTARDKGTQVNLVINPYYPPFAASITNLGDLKRRVEEVTGLKVRDYSTAISEASYFADYMHLNKNGAKVYLDVLIRDGVLK